MLNRQASLNPPATHHNKAAPNSIEEGRHNTTAPNSFQFHVTNGLCFYARASLVSVIKTRRFSVILTQTLSQHRTLSEHNQPRVSQPQAARKSLKTSILTLISLAFGPQSVSFQIVY